MTAAVHKVSVPIRPPVRCPCGHRIFDGEVVKSRVVRLFMEGGAEAKCPRCKRWNIVPVTYRHILEN